MAAVLEAPEYDALVEPYPEDMPVLDEDVVKEPMPSLLSDPVVELRDPQYVAFPRSPYLLPWFPQSYAPS